MTALAILGRVIGAGVVLIPLAVTMKISYQFGAETFGAGDPAYGFLWASFAAVACVGTFAFFDAIRGRRWDVAFAAVLIVPCCIACSAAGAWVSLGARQDQVVRVDRGRQDVAAQMQEARRARQALPPHRDRDAVLAEKAMRSEAYERAKLARHRTGRSAPWSPTPEDAARDLALINELSIIRTDDRLSVQLAELSLEATAGAGPRVTAVASWLAGRTGWTVEDVSQAMMAAFVATSELISALGLFCILGGHTPARSAAVPRPQARRAAEPAEQLELAPQPAARAGAGDPVAAFMEEMLVPEGGAITPYNDIEAAWRTWCGDRGIDGEAVNLGFALGRAGYRSVPIPGQPRKRGRGGLRIAERKAA